MRTSSIRMRVLALGALVVGSTVLSGCIFTGFGYSGPPIPPPPNDQSFNIKNICGTPVRLFIGADPMSRAGTFADIMPQQISTQPWNVANATIWLVDTGNRGYSSITIPFDRRRILATCGGLRHLPTFPPAPPPPPPTVVYTAPPPPPPVTVSYGPPTPPPTYVVAPPPPVVTVAPPPPVVTIAPPPPTVVVQPPPPPPSPPVTVTYGGPTVAVGTFTVKSNCGRVVRIFAGTGDPRTGRGQFMDIAPYGTVSVNWGLGMSLWTVGYGNRGLASVTPGSGAVYSIPPHCSGIRTGY